MFTVAEERQVLWRCVPGNLNDLAEPLCDIFNQCLRTGDIPSPWKHSEIIPVKTKVTTLGPQ